MGASDWAKWFPLPFAAIIVLGLLSAHVGLVLRQYPPSSIAHDGLPVKGDVARYLATSEGAYRIGGVGYDPLAMAGYPVGLWNSLGKKGYELLGSLFPGLSLGKRFYLLLVILSVASPLIHFFVARGIVPTVPAVLTLIVSLAVWHLDSQVGYFWSFGNVLYPGTCALLPLLFALAWLVCKHDRPVAAAVGFGVVSAWIFYAHTVVLFACVAPVIGLATWAVAARRSAAPLVWLSLAVMTGTVLVAPWLAGLLKNSSDCVPQPYQWFQAGPKHLLADLFSDRTHGRPFDRNLVLHFVTVAGVAGCLLNMRIGNERVAFIGFGGIWCLLIAYTFSYVPILRSVQPYRFLVPAVLCLSVPATAAVWEAWKIYGSSSASARRLVLAGLLVFLPGATAYALDLTQLPLPCGLSADECSLLEAIRVLPSSGRIICQPDQAAHLIPFWCGKPVLGGLNDQAFLKHRFAGMLEGGILFGRPAREWDEATLREYMETYAVEYAVFSSHDWQVYAQAHPGLFESVKSIGGDRIYIYKIKDAKPGMVLHGQGRVSVLEKTILVTGAEGTVLTKLHYSRFLRVPPGVGAVPVSLLDDPVPFLELHLPQGLDSFEIHFR